MNPSAPPRPSHEGRGGPTPNPPYAFSAPEAILAHAERRAYGTLFQPPCSKGGAIAVAFAGLSGERTFAPAPVRP